jgi:hypothetical protein
MAHGFDTRRCPCSASSSPVRCHHHDPSFAHAPCTKTILIVSSTLARAWSAISGPQGEPYLRMFGRDTARTDRAFHDFLATR